MQPYDSGQILSTGKITLNTVKYWVLQIELISIHNTVKYPRQLLATIWEHTKYRWIPLATLNTQIIFFLNVFSDGHEAATKDGDHRPFVREHPLCLFEQILPKYKYTGIYCWQPKYRQIPRYLTVFGLPTSNTSCCQIPPNTIWELAFRKGLMVFNLFV